MIATAEQIESTYETNQRHALNEHRAESHNLTPCPLCEDMPVGTIGLRETLGVTTAIGVRICPSCEARFDRRKVPASGQTAVERDYKAFLDGKRDYQIRVTITCADGSEITTPVSERLAKAFLKG